MGDTAEIGALIGGKYKILRRVGRGGTASVYLAVDVRLKKEWAVKEIPRPADGGFAGILPAEAELMKRLDYPALPRIVDIIDGEEVLYMVMDYVRGVSLDRVLRERGALPEQTVIGWGIQLGCALRYLHGQDPPVIYRDMKPANVMLTEGGSLKLVDFGIAREYKARGASDTAALGTDGYAAPEQHGLRQTDERSDIYALGMTMYHLLTGADPRNAGSGCLPVREIRPSLSAGIGFIIDKCTALDPAGRYQNCEELLRDLRHPERVEREQAGLRTRRRRLTVLILAAAGLLTAAGMLSLRLGFREDSRIYEQKLSVSDSAPYETRVESYLDAIAIFGGDPRGYLCLLRVYRERGVFGERESQQFTNLFDANRSLFDTESAEYLDLAYEAGLTYFYLYSGESGKGGRLMDRALKAYPFFELVVRSGNRDYENYEIAGSYLRIGEFYREYLADAASVKEPDRETYEGFLAAVEDCLDAAGEYEAADSAYVRLTLYRALANLLNVSRKGFAAAGVDEDSVEKLLCGIWERTEALHPARQESMEIRDEILAYREEYLNNLRRTYENTAAMDAGVRRTEENREGEEDR